VLFLTGIGEVFPYIRSHNVLNNLQSTPKDKPTVMFFPGEYRHSLEQGASLELFGLLARRQVLPRIQHLRDTGLRRDPMELNRIFNPVSRPIEGVIKADDEASLKSELRNTSSPTRSPSGWITFWMPTTTTTVPTASGSPASSVRASRTC
jgi:hypothetical protein